MPQTEATFGPRLAVDVEYLFGRKRTKPNWRQYAVFIARPDPVINVPTAEQVPAAVLIYKVGISARRLVNIRQEDKSVAMKAGRK